MAIILWKNGAFKICNEFSYEHELEDGWSLTKEPVVEEPEIEELEKEEVNKSTLIEKLKAKKLELVKDLEKSEVISSDKE